MEIKRSKYDTIRNWKSRGVIYNDFDELYYTYIRTLKCCACNKDFKNSYDRCLDHNHITGLFRAIVCRGCNSCDRYIKYPDGYDKKIYDKKYREENKEKVAKKNKKYYEANKEHYKEYVLKNKHKIYNCECGGSYHKTKKQRHLRTIKHTAWYMEQVD